MSYSVRVRAQRAAFHTAVATLVIVFVLGMAVNLWLAFPSNLPPQLAMNMPLVQFHMVAATLTLLAGIVALVLSLVERHVWGSVTALVGVALTAMAYGAGMAFLNTGYHENASMVMAVGFIGALLAYGLGAFLTSSLATRR